MTAADVVAELAALADPAELPKVRKRLAVDEPAFGLRMGRLFDVARTHTDLALDEVDTLCDRPEYEPRMAAFCILDFQVRRRLDDPAREARFDLYLARHDAITTWDMVDRAAPRVVGGWLAGRDTAVLHELAASTDPLRRRTALTAPLGFVRAADPGGLAAALDLAALLAPDPDPVVHRPAGILLKQVSAHDPDAVVGFLRTHAGQMPRPAVRLAAEKLPRDAREEILG